MCDHPWRVFVEDVLDPSFELLLHSIKEFPSEVLRYTHALHGLCQGQSPLEVLQPTGEVFQLEAAFLQFVSDGQL